MEELPGAGDSPALEVSGDSVFVRIHTAAGDPTAAAGDAPGSPSPLAAATSAAAAEPVPGTPPVTMTDGEGGEEGDRDAAGTPGLERSHSMGGGGYGRTRRTVTSPTSGTFGSSTPVETRHVLDIEFAAFAPSADAAAAPGGGANGSSGPVKREVEMEAGPSGNAGLWPFNLTAAAKEIVRHPVLFPLVRVGWCQVVTPVQHCLFTVCCVVCPLFYGCVVPQLPQVSAKPWHAYFRYERPTGNKATGEGAMATVQSLLADALSGEKRRLGFLFLCVLVLSVC